MKHKIFTLLFSLWASCNAFAYNVFFMPQQENQAYKYAVWYWADAQNGQWSDWMTIVPEHEEWLSCAISDNCMNVIFVAFEQTVQTPNWDYKKQQTGDLRYDGSNAYYREGLGWKSSFDDVTENSIAWSIEDSVLTITGNGSMLDYQYTFDIPWYPNRASVNSIVIGEGITSIGSASFFDFYLVKTISIASTVSSIGKSAFQYCSSIESIIIPEGLTYIGTSAFAYCSNLVTINIPSNVLSIGSMAFYKCFQLSPVTIPDGVTTIGADAFYRVQNINYQGTATGAPWGAISLNGEVVNPPLDYSACEMEIVGSAVANQEGAMPDTVWNWGNVYPLGTPVYDAYVYTWGAMSVLLTAGENAAYKIRTKDAMPSGAIPFAFDNGDNIYVEESGYYNIFYILDALREFGYCYWQKVTISEIDQVVQKPMNDQSKILYNGQILILRGDKTYTLTGQEVK